MEPAALATSYETAGPPVETGRVRRFAAEHPRVVDWLLVGGAVAFEVGVAVALLATDGWPPPDDLAEFVVASLLFVAAAFTLLVRRRHPLIPFVLALAMLAYLKSTSGGDALVLFPALYAMGAYAGAALAWSAFGAGTLIVVLGSVWGASMAGNVVLMVPLMLLATVLGIFARTRRKHVASLLEYASALARERERTAVLAAVEERTRIAREMHDLVGHSLTVVVTLSDGAIAQARQDPEASTRTMEIVADTARKSLTELRSVLDVLHADPEAGAALAPSGPRQDIDALIEEVRVTGLPITRATVDGEVPNAAVGLAVHRIVQESLTNTLKHGRDVRGVSIEVVYGRTSTVKVVSDAAPARRRASGRGELGMRSRAQALGGTFESGPRADGGWFVTARLPDWVPQERGTVTHGG